MILATVKPLVSLLVENEGANELLPELGILVAVAVIHLSYRRVSIVQSTRSTKQNKTTIGKKPIVNIENGMFIATVYQTNR